MAYFRAVPASLSMCADNEQELSRKLESYADIVEKVMKNVSLQINNTTAIKSRLKNVVDQIQTQSGQMQSLEKALGEVVNLYAENEQKIYSNAGGQGTIGIPKWAEKPEPKDYTLAKNIWSIVGEAGVVGSATKAIADVVIDIKSGEFGAKTILGAGKAIWSGAFSISELVGKAKKSGWAKANWKDTLFKIEKKELFDTSLLKKGVGKMAKASAAFKASWKESVSELKTAKGIGKEVFSGVINAVDNFNEYKEKYKNGEYTFWGAVGRGAVETISETGVDWAKDALITAGVSAGLAALGATAAPALVVGAAATVVSAGLDVACKWITGDVLGGEAKGLTEVVSDAVLDLGTAAVKGAGKFIGNVGNAVKSGLGNVLKTPWKGLFA